MIYAYPTVDYEHKHHREAAALNVNLSTANWKLCLPISERVGRICDSQKLVQVTNNPLFIPRSPLVGFIFALLSKFSCDVNALFMAVIEF
jgi:hypothetical protein